MERNECAESDYEKAYSGEMAFMSGGTLLMDIMSVMNQEHHGLLVK